MGSGTLFYGSLGTKKTIINNYKKVISNTLPRSHLRSKSYTTNWNELLEVE